MKNKTSQLKTEGATVETASGSMLAHRESVEAAKRKRQASRRPWRANPDGLIFGREITQESWDKFTKAYRDYYAKQDEQRTGYPNHERCVFIESTEPNACYQCGESRENHEL